MKIRKGKTTEAYKDNMDQDIKFVEKNENSKKIFQKTKWRTIYEVIDADYIQNSNIFPTAFIAKCKLYPNKPQFITQDVKNNIKLMSMDQSYIHRLSIFGVRI